MKLNIITPEKTIFSDTVSQVTIPTTDGEITVLPNHIPLVSVLKSGELLIKKGNEIFPLAVSSGFVQVRSDEVVVLADTAEHVQEIVEKRAQEAKERAEKFIADKKFDKAEFATLSAKIEKEMARLHVARKYRHRTHSGLNNSSNLDNQ